MSENNPLVSVIVLTYYSARTVVETLDSIKAQSYNKIELVVSDDASEDNTIDICNEWIKTNRDRFKRAFIIKADSNKGTSANCNRGVRACHGDWIRIIAGDDLMPEDSISLQVNYLKNHPDIKILNGFSINFKIENGKRIDLPSKKKNDINPSFYLETASYQYNYLLRHTDFGLTEGTIINRSVYNDICKYDEKYTIIEDLPFWLNVTKNGVKFYYLDIPTLFYRVHVSVVHVKDSCIRSKRFADDKKAIVDDMVKPNIPKNEVRTQSALLLDDFIYWLIFSVFNNKKSFFSKLVLSLIYRVRALV